MSQNVTPIVKDPNQPYLPGLEPPQEPLKRGGFTPIEDESLAVLRGMMRTLENIEKSLEELVERARDIDDGGYRR